MPYSAVCRVLLIAALFSPISALAQGGGRWRERRIWSRWVSRRRIIWRRLGICGWCVGSRGANGANALGTNSAGTANSSGSASGAGGGPVGSAGTAGNPPGGATGGRIDGTVTNGPAMPGDDAIRAEDSPGSKVDKRVKGICKGC